MRLILTPILARMLLRVLWGLGVTLVVAIAAVIYLLDARSELSPWHLERLDAEFTTDSAVTDFEGYLELEDRLFKQLEEQIYAKVKAPEGLSVNRFVRGSRSDPGRWPGNWNRSYEERPKEPVASVLLLHGLSDSPYSLRAIATGLRGRDVAVLGLRVPGHGTAPSGLIHTRWQDMIAAVKLAAHHLHDAAPDKPLFLVGYSNGGALSIEYTLSALQDPDLPRPAGIVLLSPEIGISSTAFLAKWLGRLGRLTGLEKLAWTSIEPEYDPFKYNSFTTNAGDLAYRLTGRIQEHLGTLHDAGSLGEMPPVLAFQSTVDATVSAPALIQHLFDRLDPNGHELVLFDINRLPELVPLLTRDPYDIFNPLLGTRDRGFDLTVITNDSLGSKQVVARTRPHGTEQETRTLLQGRWPADTFSLGHLALPFSPDDPLYGGPQAPPSPGIALGHLALRGESGALQISPKALLRVHWNPFYDHVESRIHEFMGLEASKAGTD